MQLNHDVRVTWMYHRQGRRRIETLRIAVSFALAGLSVGRAAAQQQSTKDVNAANNPLTPTITFNVQDQWAPDLYDVDPGSNALLLRGVIPHQLGGRGQLFRYTMPVVTSPNGLGGTVNGLGDLNLFDLFPFLVKKARLELAIGPQLTMPTATNDETGTGKWQGGVAMVVAAPRSFGIAGALVTWQHSFAGDHDRDTQNNLGLQPLLIYNLPQGWYLRSTATWNFAFAQDAWVIPIGAGVGKVWLRPDGATINAFAEPQFTVAHDGAGQPKFQVFMGLNLQLPPAKK
jgi:hypothetical protein